MNNEAEAMRNNADFNHDWMIDSRLNHAVDWDYNSWNLFTGIDSDLNLLPQLQEQEKKKFAASAVINMSNNATKDINEVDTVPFLGIFGDGQSFDYDERPEVFAGSDQKLKEKIDETSKTNPLQETILQIGLNDNFLQQKKITSSLVKKPLVKQSNEKLVHQIKSRKRKGRAQYLPQNEQTKQCHFDSSNRSNLTEKHKESISPTEKDVVFGRGGRANNHIGNKMYLQELKQLKAAYGKMHKSGKSNVSQRVIDAVHQNGGRFLKQEETTGTWYEVSNQIAKKKASQALREAVKRDIISVAKATNAGRKKKIYQKY